MDEYQRIREMVAERGQEHVFRFWDQLAEDEQRHLLAELDALDFDEVERLCRKCLRQDDDENQAPAELDPAPYIPLPQTAEDVERRRQARARGEEAVRRGELAAFLVAGGQGTRLGFDGPKGAYPIGPISQKTLFQLFAERIRASRQRYGTAIAWYIMTSRDNDAVTRKFFQDNGFFGLPQEDIYFFRQGLMPAVDNDGRLLLDSPGRLALTPDGHGGAIRGLKRSGALADMAERGVKYISHFQVDNVLVQPVDPTFLGFHIEAESQMSSIMVKKRSPEERVGHFCVVDGRLRVIEYSDMPAELTQQRDSSGELRYVAGSVAIHIYDTSFVERLNQSGYELPFHRAWKKVPFVNELSHRIRPRQPNANKFEMFIFDAIPAAEKTLVLEAPREETFSPVKNARGEDSVATAQADLMRQAVRWARAAGLDVPTNADGLPEHKIEVSPLFALDQDEFVEKMQDRDEDFLQRDTYLEP